MSSKKNSSSCKLIALLGLIVFVVLGITKTYCTRTIEETLHLEVPAGWEVRTLKCVHDEQNDMSISGSLKSKEDGEIFNVLWYSDGSFQTFLNFHKKVYELNESEEIPTLPLSDF